MSGSLGIKSGCSAHGEGDVSGSDLHKKLSRLLQQLRGCAVPPKSAGRGRSHGILPRGFLGTSALQPSSRIAPPEENPLNASPGIRCFSAITTIIGVINK